MKLKTQVAVGVAVLLWTATVVAQKPVTYPARGQSPKQQSKDDGECYTWAKRSSGVDPANMAPVQQQTGPATGGGERLQGAARGALGGAAIGAIAGDAGQGAGIGAVVGTMAGGRRARQNQAASNQQAQAQQQQAIGDYDRAYGACMQGRGYTVG
jgi:hypothetical protein